MVGNFAREIWNVYPNCRLHVEVTIAGTNSYKVTVSLLSDEKKLIKELEHYGTGDLFEVKAEAVQKMINQVLEAPSA